jgi:hypothetical protein
MTNASEEQQRASGQHAETPRARTKNSEARHARTGAPREKRKGLRGSPGWTLLAAALGVMMVALDGTIVSVANPAIQAHLGASLAGIQWVTNAYLLSLAA